MAFQIVDFPISVNDLPISGNDLRISGNSNYFPISGNDLRISGNDLLISEINISIYRYREIEFPISGNIYGYRELFPDIGK